MSVSSLGFRIPSAYLLIVALWALLHGITLANPTLSPVLQGGLIDTDGYMRLVRVTRLYETGAWFDSLIPRSNAPFGDVLHWTRPLDVLLLLGAAPLLPLLGFTDALFWSGALLSPLLHLLTIFVLIWAVTPLIGRENATFAGMAYLLQPAVLAYSMAGRADHHALQFLLVVLSLGLTLRLLRPPVPPRLAVAAGAVAGLGLWVSVEFMAVLAAMLAALTLSWLRWGERQARANLLYGAGLAGMVVLALAVERPPAGWLAEEYDRLSIVHALVAVLTLAVFAGWRIADTAARRALGPAGRAGAAAICGTAALVVVYALYPKFFAGPMVDVDPRIVPIWLNRVGEMAPLLPASLWGFGRLLLFVGPAAVCLPFTLWMLWRERNGEDAGAWLLLALLQAGFFVLALQHLRFASFAELAFTPVLGMLIGRLRDWIERVAASSWRATARVVATAGLLIGFAATGTTVMAATDTANQALPTPECRLDGIAAVLNDPDGIGARPRIVLSMLDRGPELLYRTRHATVGAPYHRNGAGIWDSYLALSSTDDAVSRGVIDRRGIELVLLCPNKLERRFFNADKVEGSLYARLLDGRGPAWLRPIALPENLAPFHLFEVVRP